jgi:predicted nucleic acid-binding protein
MILFDTNVILRYIAGDVPDQSNASRSAIQRVARGEEEAMIIYNVIHEACYALTSSTPGQGYNLTHLDTRNRLLPILMLKGVRVSPNKSLALQVLDIFATGEKIDYTDALLVAYVRNGRADGIYSFDKRYDRIGGANRIDPRGI